MPTNRQSPGNYNSNNKKRLNSPAATASSQKKKKGNLNSNRNISDEKSTNNLTKKITAGAERLTTPPKLLHPVSKYYDWWKY